MVSEADVAIIGSGGLGAATAYYLAKRGSMRVVLIDKHEIGSQTSPRAAGMVSCLRKSELTIGLIKDASGSLRQSEGRSSYRGRQRSR
jgi:glycine/D-amino acid oxidase-like deaminating enzyme